MNSVLCCAAQFFNSVLLTSMRCKAAGSGRISSSAPCHCCQVKYKPTEIERTVASQMKSFFGFARNVCTFLCAVQDGHDALQITFVNVKTSHLLFSAIAAEKPISELPVYSVIIYLFSSCQSLSQKQLRKKQGRVSNSGLSLNGSDFSCAKG